MEDWVSMAAEKTASVKVTIRNKYVTRRYKSMEEASKLLSRVGTMTPEEVLKLLRRRVAYINGYVVSYEG